MIDTIHLHLSPEYINNDYSEFLLENYPDLEIRQKKQIITYTLKLNNLYITYNPVIGFKIENSLTKYQYGNNQQTLTFQDITELIEELSQIFQLPLINSKVRRLDIADNIITIKPPELYCQIMESASRFKKLEQGKGLNFNTTNRAMVFYNKKKEIKNQEALEILKGQNVLRFEYRYLKHQALANFLKLTEVTLKDVLINYQIIIDSWCDAFDSITKRNEVLTFKPEVFKTKGGFNEQVKILGLNALGSYSEICTLIENAKSKGFMSYPNQSTNAKKLAKDLLSKPLLTEKSELAIELEKKVKIISFINSQEYLNSCG